MKEFLIAKGIMIVVVVIAAAVLMRIFFKKSFFKQIGTLWVLTIILDSINTEARLTFESYTQAIAMPVGIGIIAGIIIYASRIISGPLKKIVHTVEELADGKLSVKVPEKLSERNDEIGVLGQSVNKMTENYAEMLNELKKISKQLKSGTDEMLAITRQFKEFTDVQSSNIEEISANTEQIASAAEQNADFAGKTQSAVKENEAAVNHSSQTALETIESVKKVIAKIGTIDEIAWQTGILSLNASIQAANAGEAGKSFAVVADSVRKLSDKSAETAGEVHKDSAEVLKLSEAAGNFLHGVVARNNQTNLMIEQILETAGQQNSGINQINGALQEMSGMINQNKDISFRLSDMSENMKQNIDKINEMLGKFK